MSFSSIIVIAQAAPAGQTGGGQSTIIMMVLMMVMMYFILIRPQRKKQKEQETLQKALSAGDEVVTIGGAHGVVATVKEKTVVVKFAEGKVEFDRTAIAYKKAKAEEATVVDDKK
ncbi:preprotein translocase subunit YajC [Verrucomicrobium sp. BvORR106]|uniref:preprotein translocase subunit YajC n=1 Tax=Verrucomicrobium sp. BvORR106 TaxID=1403819 RepID=UPI00056EC129|nr:preprotein translocase subunit YajC [Verrucomicrobium sp. BvORR106]